MVASTTTTPESSADWNGRRCLVTGAGGFIGTALCRRLSSAGAEVWGLGRKASGPDGIGRWLSCDVTDRVRVTEAFAACKPDVVFHLASIVNGARKLNIVIPTLHANLTGFVNVAVAAAEQSSASIVAIGSLQEPDQSLPAVPSSPYAAAKFAASCYSRMFVETFKIPVVVVRLFMTYGPGQQDSTKLVPYVISQLAARREASLSRGTQAFDWVYIDDVCEALVAIASNGGLVGKTVDVGTGVLTSVMDVAHGLARRLDATDLLQFGSIPDRAGDPTRTADVEGTRALTGWHSRVELEEGLDLTVRWFKERGGKWGQ